jgi:hypothetical protein
LSAHGICKWLVLGCGLAMWSAPSARGQFGMGIGGYDLASTADRMMAFDYDSSGKQDHLLLYRPGTGIIWILKNTGGRFAPVFASTVGIAGYGLDSPADRIIAFDYDSSGKMDHLLLYRAGTGMVWILKNASGTFSAVYASAGGIGGYNLASTADLIIPFDYNSSGKQDHLLLYRPGTGICWILQNVNGSFSMVYYGGPGTGIGTYNLMSTADRIVTFDYNSTGKMDHLVLYRPGTGIFCIEQNNNGAFSMVIFTTNGIGSYNLMSTSDQILAFDYSGTGKQDHLILFRPGTGIIWMLQEVNGAYTVVFYSPGNGIGGYNLTAGNDQILAFDYNSDGKMDHIVLYRPGTGICWIEQNVGGVLSPVYIQPTSPLDASTPAKEYIYLNGKAVAIENNPQ